MTRIYLADPAIRLQQLDAIRSRLPQGWSLVDQPHNAVAILTENADVTPEMLAASGTSLRLICRLDTGDATVPATTVDVVDLPNTALTGVAEHAVMLIMALGHHLFWVARQTAQRRWLPDRSDPILTDQTKYTYNWIGLEDFGTLYRKTVGIVGLGRIGRAMVTRLQGFGMHILYTQRHRLDTWEESRMDVHWRKLDDLLRESDFVTLHLRFEEGPSGNDKQFGAREFALMRPSAYFINTSRGRVVDEDALVEAIRSGQIAGGGLDVFRYEPLPADDPLLALAGDNVVLTSHLAGAPVTEAWQTIADELVERIQAVL